MITQEIDHLSPRKGNLHLELAMLEDIHRGHMYFLMQKLDKLSHQHTVVAGGHIGQCPRTSVGHLDKGPPLLSLQHGEQS